MRKSAYIRAIDEAMGLPQQIGSYFNPPLYAPRKEALYAIRKKARLDVNALFVGELIDVLNYLNVRLKD